MNSTTDPTLAVVVTMPGRPLEHVLESLRPQVDELAVYCNGFDSRPESAGLADRVHLDSDNSVGASGKFFLTEQWDGIYLACDDDLLYPPDYVQVMRDAVQRWNGQALVTCHGRVLHEGRFDTSRSTYRALDECPETWLNYPGSCALAFDTRLQVPNVFPKNNEESALAVWAHEHQVPIWLLPHRAGWLKSLLPAKYDGPTVWKAEKAAGFANRNATLSRISEWGVYVPGMEEVFA